MELLGKGIPISNNLNNRISGVIALTNEKAIEWGREGKRVILVKRDTCPDDLNAMTYSVGILTARGGFTSHAALIAREQNKPCVVGCRNLKIDLEQGLISFDEVVLMEGQEIEIDGKVGEVYAPTC